MGGNAGVVPGDRASALERAVGRDRLAGVAARVAQVGLDCEARGRLAAGIGHGSREADARAVASTSATATATVVEAGTVQVTGSVTAIQ